MSPADPMLPGTYVVGPWYGGLVLMVVGEWTTLETPGGLLFVVSTSLVRAGVRPTLVQAPNRSSPHTSWHGI